MTPGRRRRPTAPSRAEPRPKDLERVHPDCASVVFQTAQPRSPNVPGNAMTTPTEKILSTGLALARDAGSALADAGASASSAVGTSLVKAMPKAKQLGTTVKEMISVGAGLGVAVVVARKRKQAREAAAASGTAKPTRVAAKNMRGNGASTAAKKAPAKKAAPRARKPASAS